MKKAKYIVFSKNFMGNIFKRAYFPDLKSAKIYVSDRKYSLLNTYTIKKVK
jgi:hypothetical protein